MKKFEQTIKLEKIESDLAYIDLTINFTIGQINNQERSVTYKLVANHHVLRLKSSHLVSELDIFMKCLGYSKDDKNTNEAKIILFAKEMFKANKTLNKKIKLDM